MTRAHVRLLGPCFKTGPMGCRSIRHRPLASSRRELSFYIERREHTHMPSSPAVGTHCEQSVLDPTTRHGVPAPSPCPPEGGGGGGSGGLQFLGSPAGLRKPGDCNTRTTTYPKAEDDPATFPPRLVTAGGPVVALSPRKGHPPAPAQ